ncbi:MAG TPA: 3-deoxy-manno-octulosonate cytidylyltransferase [Gammaproteobacteria bacterium]|nr:3-deoxy-manno-octulosonate cytidylyltransferase [Gammaproteobacteria bacterium]
MDFSVVIPARYGSTRLPGKALIDIAGKPMVQWVYEQAQQSSASRVIVATDDDRIQSVVEGFGGVCCMTSSSHPSGTDRLQEVAKLFDFDDDQIIVNVQGDEPLIPPSTIDQVAAVMSASDVQMATLAERISDARDFQDPNVVKVVLDANSCALYFSRAPIPWPREESEGLHAALPPEMPALKHLGIYAYRVSMLNDYVSWEQTDLERVERLEQLRALWHGGKIHTVISQVPIPPGIDTEQDLKRVIEMIERVI